MQFQWSDYTPAYSAVIESWLDTDAIKYTGLDEGWESYYKYCVDELEPLQDVELNFKLIFNGSVPLAIVVVTLSEGIHTISEFLVSPNERGNGYGSAILSELLLHDKEILDSEIYIAKAVIFPNNSASQKAFLKAGFQFESAHPDGDAWNYIYQKVKSSE